MRVAETSLKLSPEVVHSENQFCAPIWTAQGFRNSPVSSGAICDTGCSAGAPREHEQPEVLCAGAALRRSDRQLQRGDTQCSVLGMLHLATSTFFLSFSTTWKFCVSFYPPDVFLILSSIAAVSVLCHFNRKKHSASILNFLIFSYVPESRITKAYLFMHVPKSSMHI